MEVLLVVTVVLPEYIGVVQVELVILKFLHKELLLQLVVGVEEVFVGNEENCVGEYI